MTESLNFILKGIIRQDGCLINDTAEIIAAAAAIANENRKKRGKSFHAFSVKIDDGTVICQTTKQLEKILQQCRSGLKCTVYRNRGKGATIDFDS